MAVARPAPRRGNAAVVGGARNGAATGAARTLPQARPLAGWGVVRRRMSRLMLVSVALLLLASVGIFQVLQTSRVANAGYQLRALESERSELDAEIRLLEAQIAASSNLDHLRDQAQTRLGMVPAEQVMRISVSTPAPATVPMPRRYVQLPEREPIPPKAWWEHLFEAIPGLH